MRSTCELLASRAMGCLTRICVICLTIGAHGSTGLSQSSPIGQSGINDVRTNLGTELQHLSSQNYKQASGEVLASIERGTAKRFPLQLEAGRKYAIVGACDRNCDHVQLSLFDTAGAQLVTSPDKQSVVIIGGAPAVAGSYTLELAAPGCKEKVCQAGFIVNRYEISAAAPNGDGVFVAHVSSERSREEALATYGRLKEQAPGALANKEAMIETVDLGPRGIWHRLRIGPVMSEGEVLTLCGVIKASGHDYCSAQLFESTNDTGLASPGDQASLGVPSDKSVRRRDPQLRPADTKAKTIGKPEQETQPTSGGRRCTNVETSCSGARRYCIHNCAQRKTSARCSIDCVQAFNLCMETGAWSTFYCSRTGLAQR
jgi:hypothetical protein